MENLKKNLKVKNIIDSQSSNDFDVFANNYVSKLKGCFSKEMNDKILNLAKSLLEVWEEGKNVFLCGNGGSAGNAIHIEKIPGLKVTALTANPAVLTCLGNDIGFENIFSYQLKVKANKNDILIALSGSGNSPNILSAIKTANKIGLKTFGILAFSGGKCKDIVNHPIHFEVNDMQIAEDIQLIIGHLCMQWLSNNKPKFNP